MALPEGLPQYSLGWGVLDWCTANLFNPDSVGGEKDAAWIFKVDQIKFVLWFYAVNEHGEWIYTQAYRERAKGTGKSPMVAAIGCAEFLGPVVFSHFECEHGNTKTAHCDGSKPVGRENPEAAVWLAACSESGTDHTYGYILGMLTGPASKNYNLDVGATRCKVRGNPNKIMKQVTASPSSLQGPRPTYVICEETQEWTPAKDGPALMKMIILGLSKTQGRYIEVTNAPEPGKGTVAEQTHKQYQEVLAGLARDPGLLFDTFMIHVDDVYDEEQAIAALTIMYADAPWMPPHLTYARFFNQGLSEVDVRRFYFNEIVPPHAMWIAEKLWNPQGKAKKLKKDELISLGFRIRKQCAAIVATRLNDNAVFLLKMWEKPSGGPRNWEVPYTEIDGKVRNYLSKYYVYNLVASPENFQDIVGRWSIDYEGSVEIEEFWTSRNKQKTADAVEQFETGITSKRVIHDGNKDLTRHVMNSFVEEVGQGKLLRMETPSSSRYIVAAEAAVLSMYAAQVAIEDGALKPPPDDGLYYF